MEITALEIAFIFALLLVFIVASWIGTEISRGRFYKTFGFVVLRQYNRPPHSAYYEKEVDATLARLARDIKRCEEQLDRYLEIDLDNVNNGEAVRRYGRNIRKARREFRRAQNLARSFGFEVWNEYISYLPTGNPAVT
ncbi:hypothetical protein A2155_01020 [candidate division WWE3 bacterium RBG_16_52_45]|nr:MAG: hypothetical protein A2155_01020 [candidate division WWE3 bacterium RBG_16_52_45]